MVEVQSPCVFLFCTYITSNVIIVDVEDDKYRMFGLILITNSPSYLKEFCKNYSYHMTSCPSILSDAF